VKSDAKAVVGWGKSPLCYDRLLERSASTAQVTLRQQRIAAPMEP
jgi:hypothetical protein